MTRVLGHVQWHRRGTDQRLYQSVVYYVHKQDLYEIPNIMDAKLHKH
jgi:hypothetical protein